MINVSYKFECKELLNATNDLFKGQKKMLLIMTIFGYAFGSLILFLAVFKGLKPIQFLIIMSTIVLILSFLLMLTLILRNPNVSYKRLKRKNHPIIKGVEYNLIIDDGKVTVKEKNSKAELVTEMKADEYKKIILKDKFYYFYTDKKVNSIQLILPKKVFTSEQIEELIDTFGDKYQCLG